MNCFESFITGGTSCENKRDYEQTPKCSRVKSAWRITAQIAGKRTLGRFRAGLGSGVQAEGKGNQRCTYLNHNFRDEKSNKRDVLSNDCEQQHKTDQRNDRAVL